MKRLAAVLLCFFGVAGSAAAIPPLGLNHWGQLSAPNLSLLSQHDLSVYRVKVSWAETQTDPGAPDWSAFDRLMARASCAGMDVLPVLQDSPSWISPNRSDAPVSEPDQAQWAAWVREVIARYGPGGTWNRGKPVRCSGRRRTEPTFVEAVQVWNEPNTGSYWFPRPNAVQYARLLEVTHQAVHAVNPSVAVIAAGLAARDVQPGRFVENVLAEVPAERLFDGMALHLYQRRPRQALAAALRMREGLDQLGADKAGLWVTEFGNSSGPTPDPAREHRQAAWLSRTARLLWSNRGELKLRTMLWFSYQDVHCRRSSPIYQHCYTGLRRADDSPKPSWFTAVRLARRFERSDPD